MLLSIITVMYNSECCVEKTFKNILKYITDDMEYIVIDGASNDGSLDIIKKYENLFNKKNASFRYISEKDHGIYDAMNKGVDLARGDWCLYINADDGIYKNDFIEILKKPESNYYDVIYGDIYKTNVKTYHYETPPELSVMTKRDSVFHQSALIKTQKLKEYKYDTSYKIVGDYKLFLRMYLDKNRFLYYPHAIGIMDVNGVSSTNVYSRVSEDIRLHKEYGLLDYDADLKLKQSKNAHKLATFKRRIPLFVNNFMRVYYRGWKYIKGSELDEVIYPKELI